MTTRTLHVVRVKKKNDDGSLNDNVWADVVVFDAINVRGPNGDETTYMTTAKNSKPCIVDNTGDGNDKGSASNCTRVSHMSRLTNPDDDTQYLDVEVLDAFAVRGPNGDETSFVLLADDKAEAAEKVTDNTGSGLSANAGASTARAMHVAKIKELESGTGSTNTDYPPVDPNVTDKYALVKRMDAVAYRGPNGDEQVITFLPESEAEINDTTSYTIDSDGNKVPPDRNDDSDPNIYVFFPKDSAGPWLGKKPISQGPLWFIKALKSEVPGLFAMNWTGSSNQATQINVVKTATFTTPATKEFPNGQTFNIFSDINSIGAGNSAKLTLPKDAVFTADSPVSLTETHQLDQPGFTAPVTNKAVYQTIFVNLAKFPARKVTGTKDTVLRFLINLPSLPSSVNAKQWFVAWDNSDFPRSFALGPPTNYTFTSNGLTIYDQQAAFRALAPLLPTGASVMCGQIFETEADAVTYATAHNMTGHYYLTEMYVGSILLTSAYQAFIHSFNNDQKTDFQHPHGPYEFPLSIPVLDGNGRISWPQNTPGFHAGQDWNWNPWDMGYFLAGQPWPQNQDFRLSIGSGADQGPLTQVIDVYTSPSSLNTGSGKNAPSESVFRVTFYSSVNAAPLLDPL